MINSGAGQKFFTKPIINIMLNRIYIYNNVINSKYAYLSPTEWLNEKRDTIASLSL